MYTGDQNPCEICGTVDEDKPMIYRGMLWCSDNHRKMIIGDIPKAYLK